MGRKVEFIPAGTSSTLIALEDVPDDVKEEIEEAYTLIRENDGRIRVTFDTEDEAKLYMRQAASYATQRPAGALKFRKSPTRDLPKNVVDFRVTADLEANGKANANKGPND